MPCEARSLAGQRDDAGHRGSTPSPRQWQPRPRSSRGPTAAAFIAGPPGRAAGLYSVRSSLAPAFSRAVRTTVDRPESHSTETSIGPDSSGLPCFSTPGWPLSTSAPAGRVPAVFAVPGARIKMSARSMPCSWTRCSTAVRHRDGYRSWRRWSAPRQPPFGSNSQTCSERAAIWLPRVARKPGQDGGGVGHARGLTSKSHAPGG